MNVFETLILPNGSTIPSRIAKSAMEENMADADHSPSDGLMRLYHAWADGGAELLISGNVMIDRRAMTGPAAACSKTTRSSIHSAAGRESPLRAARSSTPAR